MTRNDFNKDEKPRKPRIQNKKVEELENELSLVKESYIKEIERVTLQLNKDKEIIKQQASLIDKYVKDLEAFQYSFTALVEKFKKFQSRNLFERIINKKVEI